MTVLSLRRHTSGLGLSPRRSRPSTSTPPGGDILAPSVPQNLSATIASAHQIDLSWEASTDNVGVTGYNIYRDNALIDTSPTNAYSDEGLAIETAYLYEVSAFDAAANESARSDPVSATTAVARLLPEFVQRGAAGVETNAASNVGFTYPAEDVREDDLFLAVVAVNDRGGSANVADSAAGWTRIGELLHGRLALAAFYRRATGAESGVVAPFSWSSSDGGNDVALCQAYQYRHVDWDDGPVVGAVSSTTGNLTSLGLPSVTTLGQNGLAVAALGFTDDLAGNLAGTVAATGGTWVQPRDRDQTTSADDAAVCVYQAPLAAAGTISGGAVSPTGTTPTTSLSAALGFALLGLVDPEDYEQLDSNIAASADDAREVVATTVVTINSATIFVLSTSTGGLRFTGLAALAGKTVLQANLQLTASGTEGSSNNTTWTVRGEAADAAAQYAAVNGNISSRPTTAAARTWTLPSWTANDRTIRQRSPDLRDIVQEIVDRPGYGGVVNLIITGNTAAGRTFAAQDHATLQEATLTVRYLP